MRRDCKVLRGTDLYERAHDGQRFFRIPGDWPRGWSALVAVSPDREGSFHVLFCDLAALMASFRWCGHIHVARALLEAAQATAHRHAREIPWMLEDEPS